ncbi:MAG TPA: hypothetical protein VNM41_01885 [Solirubrobacterales bacterium]|nr:hypothetical protein [Solirubrobacterales bacterium]
MRGTGRHSRHTRLQAIAAGFAALAVAASLAACGGGDSSSTPEEPGGKFAVKVTEAEFPSLQRLGQTTQLRLGIRNTGDRTVPGLTVSFTIKGQRGEDSALPFGVSDPAPEIAQPDRPVWVLAATYPHLDGSSDPGGTSTSSPKTFALGPLKPGETTTAIWKLSAVRAGKFTLLYDVGAGLGGAAKAETDNGVSPGGSFSTEVTDRLPETEVTDDGEIVEVKKGK